MPFTVHETYINEGAFCCFGKQFIVFKQSIRHGLRCFFPAKQRIPIFNCCTEVLWCQPSIGKFGGGSQHGFHETMRQSKTVHASTNGVGRVVIMDVLRMVFDVADVKCRVFIDVEAHVVAAV